MQAQPKEGNEGGRVHLKENCDDDDKELNLRALHSLLNSFFQHRSHEGDPDTTITMIGIPRTTTRP
jgi:hypothetical protein